MFSRRVVAAVSWWSAEEVDEAEEEDVHGGVGG